VKKRILQCQHQLNKFIILLALLLCKIGVAFADTPTHRYQIELIIFSHITAESLHAEQWQWKPTDYPVSANAVELTDTHQLSTSDESNDKAANAIAVLAKPSYHLMKEDQNLRKQPYYHILLHLAWQQEITDNGTTHQPIHIFGGHLYTPAGKSIGMVQDSQPSFDLNTIWEVNGEVLLTHKRYITLYLNLLFTEPLGKLVKKEGFYNVDKNFAYFHLEQNRRMRTRELNYIDHPLYGVLIKITPIETP